VKEALGLDRCVKMVTGAAPISRETLEFLAALGVEVMELYGMSESTGIGTTCRSSLFRFGSCGARYVATEMKIDHNPERDKPGEGEICLRGRHVMLGYLHNPEKSREAIDNDGWLHSGDVGRFDDGMLYITGRIKELVIGAGGENIAPVPIENEIKRLHPGLSNVIVIGDKRKYNVCLVTLKTHQNPSTGSFLDTLAGEAAGVNPAVSTVSEAARDPSWESSISRAIKLYNEGPVCVSHAARIQKFAVLPTDLSIPGGELTGTMKIKRSFVAEKYKELIDSLYAE
jgi:long-chain-fatty-acid--CoA ligase ACSBG